jgi:hypothetical protein
MDDFIKLEQGVEKIQDAVLKGVEDNVTGTIIDESSDNNCRMININMYNQEPLWTQERKVNVCCWM